MHPGEETLITEEAAIAIAEADAREHYGDLSRFTVTATYKNERWLVDFAIEKRKYVTGGAPSYVLNAFDGTIILRILRQ
jgi:hypothetical protein